jgi:hypothetical protein
MMSYEKWLWLLHTQAFELGVTAAVRNKGKEAARKAAIDYAKAVVEPLNQALEKAIAQETVQYRANQENFFHQCKGGEVTAEQKDGFQQAYDKTECALDEAAKKLRADHPKKVNEAYHQALAKLEQDIQAAVSRQQPPVSGAGNAIATLPPTVSDIATLVQPATPFKPTVH